MSLDVSGKLGEAHIESFDIGVLRWLSRLDVIESDSFGFRPLGQGLSDEFRAVVQANLQRRIAYINQLVQSPDDPRGQQASVNLDAQARAAELVDDPGVVACNRSVAQRRAGDATGLAGSSLAHAVLGNEGLNDHLATLWGRAFGQRRP